MGALFSSVEDRRAERNLNKLMAEIVKGKLDEIPLPRADEQLAVLPPRLGRLHAIYQLDGNQYIATISSIICSDLANVELMGENDPYVLLRYGSWDAKTEVRDGAGKEAEWEKLNFCFPTSDRSMSQQRLHLEVLDYNSYRTHVAIGEAYINLSAFVDHVGFVSSLADHVGHEVEIVMDLLNSENKRTGKLVLFVTIEPSVEVSISRISCTDLKNVEFMGSNDPYVTAMFADFSAKTAFIDGAGSSAEWNKLGFWFQSTVKTLRSDTLKLQVTKPRPSQAGHNLTHTCYKLTRILTQVINRGQARPVTADPHVVFLSGP